MKKIAMLFNLNRHQYEYETEFDSELTIDSIYNVLSKKYEVKKIVFRDNAFCGHCKYWSGKLYS